MSDNVDSASPTAPTNGVQESDGNPSQEASLSEDPKSAVTEEKTTESGETTENAADILTPVSTAQVQNEENATSELNDDVKTELSSPSEVETVDAKAPVADEAPKEEPECAKSAQMDEKLEKSEDLSKEALIDDGSASKENVDKSNTLSCALSDDLIFVKPKDKDRGHCYCGKDRNLNIVELICANCNHWFHESCISYQLGMLVPFMMNYVFYCKNCSRSGLETFQKKKASIQQLCVTAIGNLMQTSIKEGKPKKFFSKDKDIIPFIESHWEGMNTAARRVTQSWHSTILRELTKNAGTYFVVNQIESDTTFGLFNPDITQIKPNYDAMLKGGHHRVGVQPVGATGVKGRGGAKRKAPGEGPNAGVGKRNRIDTAPVKLSPHGYPLEHPYNKDGFRYFLAEPDPHAPFRQEFDESSELAGKPIPEWLYRSLCPNAVLIALHDRAPQLKVCDDRLSLVGEKGYCMARATHCVSRGMWYYEVNVEEMRDGSACRIGWGQAFANLQTPLGFDKFGYCWRSRKGTKFHEARGKHYSSGYGEGDTLGLLVYLPDTKSASHLPQTLKDRPLIKFKSHLYYEEKDNIAEKTKALTPLKGSKIVFFKNGECQGEAFADIYEGQYYPAVSLYKPCVLSLNFGPDFKHPPDKKQYPFRAMWERAEETICEQTLSDLIYLTENEGKLKLDL